MGTANSLDPLPAPLRDRMRALSVPEPSAEDLKAPMPLVMNDVARERGMATAWVDPLYGTERGRIAEHWPGSDRAWPKDDLRGGFHAGGCTGLGSIRWDDRRLARTDVAEQSWPRPLIATAGRRKLARVSSSRRANASKPWRVVLA